MRFTHNGVEYKLEFSRHRGPVKAYVAGERQEFQSTYPFTTAQLVTEKSKMDKVVHAIATVGCNPVDAYSNEQGRIAALRKLTAKMDKGLRKAIWQSYTNRARTAQAPKDQSIPAQTQ